MHIVNRFSSKMLMSLRERLIYLGDHQKRGFLSKTLAMEWGRRGLDEYDGKVYSIFMRELGGFPMKKCILQPIGFYFAKGESTT